MLSFGIGMPTKETVPGHAVRTNNKRILIIEDEIYFADILCRTMRTIGLHATSAADGALGLEAARIGSPDLVVLDLGIPALNGFQVLRAMRERQTTASIPIVVMTGLPDPAHILASAADALQARCFLYKPFPMGDLKSVVFELLSGGDLTNVHSERVVLSRGHARIDIPKRKFYWNGKEVPLSSFNRLLIMAALLGHEEGVSRETLLREACPGSDSLNAIDVAIHRLKRELEGRGLPLSIEGTGHGYRLLGL